MTYHVPGLAERAVAHGFETLADSEALELFLSRSLLAGAGAKAAAKALLNRFGSLTETLGADYPALRGLVGHEAALDLKLAHTTMTRCAREAIGRRPVIASWSALLAYVKTAMAGERREQFRVIFLDKKNRFITDEVMNRGTVDHAPVYPREVARRALEVDASAIVLVHNHPSGDPTPSSADVDMTRQVVEALKALRIAVHDHLVVGRDGTASMKALGLI